MQRFMDEQVMSEVRERLARLCAPVRFVYFTQPGAGAGIDKNKARNCNSPGPPTPILHIADRRQADFPARSAGPAGKSKAIRRRHPRRSAV